MKTQHLIHVGWAVAAIAAFYIGSKATDSDSQDSWSYDPVTGQELDGSRSGSDSRFGSSSSSRNGRGERNTDSAAGPLEKLFGSYSLDRVGLKALTIQSVTDPSPITRRLAFAKVLENMTEDNVMEIREQLVEHNADDRIWTEFNYAMGALKGREAFDFALQSDEPDLNATLMGWAATDPQGAIAAMASLPEELEGQRARLVQNLIAGLADNNIDLATQVALEMSPEDDPRQTNRLMYAVANEALRKNGPEAAATWVNSLPEGDAKGAAMRRITQEYARKDPQAAAAWAQDYADKPYAASAIGEISGEWAETNAAAATQWLETLPEGNAQNRGFSEALGEWEDRDPDAATAYLKNMSDSPQRDAAIAGFTRGYAWQDPQAAIQWAGNISDPQLRTRSLIRVGYAYHRRDPENARVWLENSGLTPAQQREAKVGRR